MDCLFLFTSSFTGLFKSKMKATDNPSSTNLLNNAKKAGKIITTRLFLFGEVWIFSLTERQKRSIYLVALWLFIAWFAFLVGYVIFISPQYIDVHISEEIQEKHNGFLDSFMKAISWFGRIRVSALLVSCTTIFFLLKKRKRDAILMSSTLLSGGIAWVLKTLINRPRPTANFVSILEETQYQSFPSGHVLFYTVFFGSLIIIFIQTIRHNLYFKVSGILTCILMIFLGAVSRVYLGAHWFTDVLGGFMAGMIYLLIAGNIYFKRSKSS